MKKCVYCGGEVSEDCAIDICEKCGVENIGKKMFDAIKQNMEKAKSNGDLCHMNNTNEFIGERERLI